VKRTTEEADRGSKLFRHHKKLKIASFSHIFVKIRARPAPPTRLFLGAIVRDNPASCAQNMGLLEVEKSPKWDEVVVENALVALSISTVAIPEYVRSHAFQGVLHSFSGSLNL
jgi:hypothetical protein